VLGPHIVHTHAKDALVRDDGRYQEVPLGQGWVDWPRYLAYLRAVGYHGYFAVERETGDDPVGDITRAVQFLRQVL
jgi:sugar phosphate isomerase/epimerase